MNMDDAHEGKDDLRHFLALLISDSLWFWEPRRLVFNAVLAVQTAIRLGWDVLRPGSPMSGWIWTSLIMLAVIANLLYCTAYPVDIFLQLSGERERWRRWRGMLWLAGTLLAMLLTSVVLAVGGPG